MLLWLMNMGLAGSPVEATVVIATNYTIVGTKVASSTLVGAYAEPAGFSEGFDVGFEVTNDHNRTLVGTKTTSLPIVGA